MMVVSGVLAAVLGVAAVLIPAPYVIESPGPAINTIGQSVISVSGRQTYPTAGSLDLTTVHLTGGLPESQVNIFQVLRAWAGHSETVYPQELIYAPGESQQAVSSENTAAMTSSQENATAAALGELGISYTTKLAVAAIPAGGAASGILAANDVLVSIDGKPITDLAVIQDALAAGAGKPAVVVVDRAGTTKSLTVTPKKSTAGKYQLGIEVQNQFVFPFDVQISLSNIGGPSAGMIFALGIIDTLTPGPLTGGKHFAGTGTIDPQGNVGAIGGIAQKMIGARSSGATYFLAPAANCSDVVGHVPSGLQVIKVETLKQAYADVKLIGSGQDSSKLPTCQ